LCNAGAYPFADAGGILQGGLRQQDHEFFTAKTSERIAQAQFLFDSAGHLAQYIVAALMAEAVVDALEMVDIDEQARQGRAVPLRAADFFLHALFQIAAVVDAGQLVGQADMFETFIVDDVSRQMATMEASRSIKSVASCWLKRS